MVDRHDAGADVIFDLGLFKMQLHQFVDLQDLAKRNEKMLEAAGHTIRQSR